MFLVGSIGPLLPYLLIVLMPLLMAGLQDFGKYESENHDEANIVSSSKSSEDSTPKTVHFDNISYLAVLFNNKSNLQLYASRIEIFDYRHTSPYLPPVRHLFGLKAPPFILV